jgi:hypothetical protein
MLPHRLHNPASELVYRFTPHLASREPTGAPWLLTILWGALRLGDRPSLVCPPIHLRSAQFALRLVTATFLQALVCIRICNFSTFSQQLCR